MQRFPRTWDVLAGVSSAILALACASGAAQFSLAEGVSAKASAASQGAAQQASLVPERIILTWNGDPRTTQAVTWHTGTGVTRAVAEIARGDAGPGFPAKADSVLASSQTLLTDAGPVCYHTACFSALEPGRRYVYRVGNGNTWSEWFQFRTAPDKPERFCFLYFGDAQNDICPMWSRVIREAYSDSPRASFMIHAGDLVNRGDADAQWGEWFAAGHWVNAMVPSIPAAGNHEYRQAGDGQRVITAHWRAQFALPDNGPAGLEETCYSLVYQNLRIVVLNSNSQITAQAEWLDQVLRKNRSLWVVCTFHHPIFSTAKQRDNPELRAAWKPVLDKYRVDLVLQGHDHTYGRTGLATPAADAEPAQNVSTGHNTRDARTGTVYVVSVSGPKMYNLNRKPFIVRAAEDTQLYQIISIDGGTLEYEARTPAGDVYDAFILRKSPGQINELIERGGGEERLRGKEQGGAERQ